MANKKSDGTDVPATYLIPSEIKSRLEEVAQEQDTSASRIVRQIFRDWFKRRKIPNLETEAERD